jgi:hypothetical protein
MSSCEEYERRMREYVGMLEHADVKYVDNMPVSVTAPFSLHNLWFGYRLHQAGAKYVENNCLLVRNLQEKLKECEKEKATLRVNIGHKHE